MFLIRFFILLAVSVGLAACVSTDKRDGSADSRNYNAEFSQLIKQFRQSPESVTYDKLWLVYLKSDQIENSAAKQDEYMQYVQKLEDNEINCADVDWEDITQQNFWSIKPHISAQTCYESLGNTAQASFHTAAIEFILSGILSNGDGKNYYTAYEIATWGDAADVIEFSGYEVVDSYLELKHYGQALYYIYVVNDPESGFQKEIYFENNKFLHEILDVQYPFASINDLLKTSIVDFFSKTDGYAKIAKAKLLVSEGQYDEAVQMYLSATNDGSATANFLLGVLCHNEKQTILPRSDCAGYLFQAAEMGYMNASIALAFAYKEGIEVEQNEQLFTDIMASVEGSFEPGEAWFKFAVFYNNLLGIKDDTKAQEYLNKAADLGSAEAELASVMMDLENLDESDKKQRENIIDRLKTVAEKGLDLAQATYANFLIRSNEKGSAEWNEAKLWIDKSVAQGHPYANYLAGNAYQFGYFADKDLLKAYLAYNNAAMDYHPASQLQVGYFNDIGRVVETDKGLALSWYLLCSKANNLTCIRNLGVFFRDGIVVEQNFGVASEYFRFASDRGHTQSTISLGSLYWNGNGVEKSLDKANELFSLACDNRDGEACDLLARSYLNGEGVEIDLDKTNALFEKSCNYGHSNGCNTLANSYERGRGVDLNYPRAAQLYERSCEMGNAMSCSNLGYMYKQGNGLEQDINKAKELYIKACNGGNQIGCANYRGLLE